MQAILNSFITSLLPSLGAILKDLIFPAVVAVLAAVASYYSTLSFEERREDKNRSTARIAYIDNLLINFNKLITAFTSLSQDLKDLNYFQLKRIQSLLPLKNRILELVDEVALIDNLQLRGRIILQIDNTTTVIDEINSLENYPLNEHRRLREQQLKFDEENRDLVFKLMSEGITLSKRRKAEQIQGKSVDPASLDVANKIVKDFDEKRKELEQSLDQIAAVNEKRRVLHVVEMVDIKGNLQEIVRDLELLKQKLS